MRISNGILDFILRYLLKGKFLFPFVRKYRFVIYILIFVLQRLRRKKDVNRVGGEQQS